MPDLQSVMEHIATTWVCDESRYPQLARMSADERINFRVSHSLKHIQKTTGKIAVVSENFDHEGHFQEADAEELKTLAVKFFVNALKLAEEVGLSAEDLLRLAPQFVH